MCSSLFYWFAVNLNSMAQESYAVVSYIPGRLGSFIDDLRRRFDPQVGAWLAHVTILPPRPLEAPLDGALEMLRQQCASFDPFDVNIQEVRTFWPVSGVVYLGLSSGAELLCDLHNTLNAGPLEFAEPHDYVPHITIAQELGEWDKDLVMAEVEGEWVHYPAEAWFRVESLFLVKKTPENRWVDLAPIPLGGRLVHSSR
jgi:2'-5' RNA ligase